MEQYKYVDDDVLVMVMTENKRTLPVIIALHKFADRLEQVIVASDKGE